MGFTYKKTKDSWGTKAIYEGREFVFNPQTKSGPQTKALNVFGVFNLQSKEIWLEALRISKKRKTSKLLGVDLFSAMLNRKDLGEIFQRLEFTVPDAKIIIENYCKLIGQTKNENLERLPFLALEESIKLHSPNIPPLMLVYGLMVISQEDNIVQAIFQNRRLTLTKIEILACWILDLNYEFPKFSREQKFLECCQKLKILEGHNGCLFTYPAVELAVHSSLNVAQATKLLVRSALKAKLAKIKVINESLIKKFLL